MDNENTQYQIDSFKNILVINDFLKKTEIRNAEQLMDSNKWNELDSNYKNNDDGTFSKWMPLFYEYQNKLDTREFNILDTIDAKIKDILKFHANYRGLHVKNCSIFSSNTARPYYSEGSYPVDESGQGVQLGVPSTSGFDCLINLDKIKEWKLRDWTHGLTHCCILFLSDNVQGGKLVFPEHKIEISPSRNKLVIFPPTPDYISGDRPVSSGVKNCYLSWYGSANEDV